MAIVAPAFPSSGVGELLRSWRQRRRLSQLDLAHIAEVSARHLSFVETGRSKPSRELVLHLAEHLEVPLRDRNALLIAAGYAPVYQHRALDDSEMVPIREALDLVLSAHEPLPALIVDRSWDLVSANSSALDLFTTGVDPALLQPPVNVYRLALHPQGLAPRVRNFAPYSRHLMSQLEREAALTGDDGLAELLAELQTYPGLDRPFPTELPRSQRLFLPVELTGPDGQELSLFSTIATFGTALDVTVSELSIESFFPADEATRQALGLTERKRPRSAT